MGKMQTKYLSVFCRLYRNLNMDAADVKDKTFETDIKSLFRFINSFKSSRCVPAENLYYSKRVEALKIIQKEHQQNIDRALGVTRKAPSLSGP